MRTFEDPNKLKEYVINLVGKNELGLISVDGIDGSGKSTLALCMVQDTDFCHIDLDDDKYRIAKTGKFVDSVRCPILKEKVSRRLSENRTTFVNGVCVQKVLEKTNLIPDMRIYVKKSSDWINGDKFDYSRDVEEVIREHHDKSMEDSQKFEAVEARVEGKEVRPRPKEGRPNQVTESLCHEIIRYHYEYQPDKNAEILFERNDRSHHQLNW